MTPTINADDVRSRVQELPALPKAVHEIARALNDDDLRLDVIAKKIAIDPAMVTRILRAANSPFYGMSGSIGGVDDAVRLIGIRTVGVIIVTNAIVRTIAPPKCPGFDFHHFWEHSIATAVCAQELARETGYSPSVAFSAGLLHDIGHLALATYFPSELGDAITYAGDRDCLLYDAEVEVLGLGHSTVGAWIATQWNFAESVSNAIQQHHDPCPDANSTSASLADIVHAADGIVHALDMVRFAFDMVPLLQLASWQRLNIPFERFPRLFERTQGIFSGMKQAIV